MTIQVTREHIDNAVRRDSHRCMIADAIRDAFPAAQYILVDLQSIRWTDPEAKERYAYFTPPLAQRALLRFDQGKPVQPFTFRLGPAFTRAMGWAGQRSPMAVRHGKQKYEQSETPFTRYSPKAATRRPIVAYKVRQFGLRVFK
jgi:hypothetical protein